jgi:TerC family integral membrane protein
VDVAAWVWTVPVAALVAAVAAEARLAARRGAPGPRGAAAWAGLYVALAVAFGGGIAAADGWAVAGQFAAGYLTEYSLSLDNLFVFYVIMRWFAVPPASQHRVLMAGIVLALVLRSALIVAGSAAVSHFGWLFYPLGGLLVWTAARLAASRPGDQPQEPRSRLMSWLRRHARATDDRDAGRLVTWRSGWPAAGPLLLLAVAIGSADLLFAVDSIPALLGITTRAWLIVACNAFALTGLRQVYVLMLRVLDRITFLAKGLAVICAFIGAKLLLEALRSSGAAWAPGMPAWVTPAVVGTVLLVTVTAGAVTSSLRAGNLAPGDGAGIPGEQDVLRRRFAVFDIDGNGVWQRADYEELTRRLCEAFGHAADSEPGRAVAAGQRALFDALLAHMDTGGDQQITPDEFTGSFGRAIADRHGFDSAVSAAATSLLHMADQDGNGVLGPAEYARLAAAYGASAAQAAGAFARLDLDDNGVLDTAEFTAAVSQFFASRDADVPGNLAFGRL